MRIKVLVVAWITFSLAGAGKVMALPQEAGNQGQPAESRGGGAQQAEEQKSTNGRSRDGESSVTTFQRGGRLVERFLLDQKEIVTSPGHLGLPDAGWIVPLGGFASSLFITDAQFSHHLNSSPATISHYKNISDAGVAALIGGAGGLWLMSFPKHNPHWRETGFLAGEAALNSLLDVEVLKYSLRRERPYQGNGNGAFFQSGGTSFPSEHAAAAFSVAGVIAHEYPGPIPKLLAYGLATAVSISRVKAKQHFNSDVLIGGVMGDMIAQSVYSRHFDPELGGAAWTSTSQFFHEHWRPSPKSFGSPFVPLDSWIYPALERLAAMGFVKTEFEGLKPWTRLECTGLYQEAETNVRDRAPEFNEANKILSDLRAEFEPELKSIEEVSNNRAQIESVYVRSTEISGKPLNDSYHFGQTLINNDGRPYEEGYNNSTGFSAYALDGRFALYVSGEYQHAPSAPAYTLAQRQIIANIDLNPLQPAQSVAEVNQFVLEDTYLATNIEGWNFSFGKQSLWWGPDFGSAFLYSNNATPEYMFQVSRVTPFELPWILHYFGPAKIGFFFGRPQGNMFPGRPLMHGIKISFKPTPNLELGFSATSEFGGIGRPMTAKAIINSFIAFSTSVNYGANDSPGKRTGGFDFTYRLPFVRNWLSLYVDSMSPDDPSPLDAPRRPAANPGIYLSHFPHLPWLDLRFEVVYTETPTRDPYSSGLGGQYVYWEGFYHDLYTNKGNIIGSWIGREGKGYQAWSTAHFGPKNNLQFAYRHAEVASDFIPRGEAINDGSVQLNRWIGKEMSVSAFLQYERWNVPVLAATPQTNWTSSVQVTFWPRSWK
jgi:membrane-associated phospholipid phosphatase